MVFEKEDASPATYRLLAAGTQVECVLGKGGKVVDKIRVESGAQVRVLGKEQMLACASVRDEVIQVAITPEVISKSVCRTILSQLVTLYKDSHLGMRIPAYDGRKSLYTAGELSFTFEKFKIKLTGERGVKEYDVVIKLAGRVDLHHLKQFLLGRQHDTPQETIQVLDVVLRETPSTNYVTIS